MWLQYCHHDHEHIKKDMEITFWCLIKKIMGPIHWSPLLTGHNTWSCQNMAQSMWHFTLNYEAYYFLKLKYHCFFSPLSFLKTIRVVIFNFCSICLSLKGSVFSPYDWPCLLHIPLTMQQAKSVLTEKKNKKTKKPKKNQCSSTKRKGRIAKKTKGCKILI